MKQFSIQRSLHILGPVLGKKPYPVRLWIQDMKNYYVDFYRFASKHVHFIHFKARSRLPNEVVAKVEDGIKFSKPTRRSTKRSCRPRR